MYQWCKFEFFKEKAVGRGGGAGGGSSSAAVPVEIAGRVTCYSGGRSCVTVGCDDGTMGLLDRGFQLSYDFQAHTSSVLFLQQLEVQALELDLMRRDPSPLRKVVEFVDRFLVTVLVSVVYSWVMCN